jgi:hypothetical protein
VAPCVYDGARRGTYVLRIILLVFLILLLLGSLPAWPYSAHWGYYPSGGFGALFVIVLVLILLDVL